MFILFAVDYLVLKKKETNDLLFWVVIVMFNFWFEYIIKDDE